MNDDWILDVLADLKSFAEKNDLPLLAVQLRDSHRLAAIELALRPADRSMRLAAQGDEAPDPTGPLLRRARRTGRGES